MTYNVFSGTLNLTQSIKATGCHPSCQLFSSLISRLVMHQCPNQCPKFQQNGTICGSVIVTYPLAFWAPSTIMDMTRVKWIITTYRLRGPIMHQCTKISVKSGMHGGVTDDLTSFLSLFLREDLYCHFLRDKWTQKYQICGRHRPIIGTHWVCFTLLHFTRWVTQEGTGVEN